jgi:hypothetical protein
LNERFRTAIVDATMRAEALAARRDASLRCGEIDVFFHYQGVAQAQRWLAVHRAHAPHFGDATLDQSIHALADELARIAPNADVVALGPGAGSKERAVLAALTQAGRRPRYLPIDASIELALLSADVAIDVAQAPIVPMVGDLSLVTELAPWLDQQWDDRPRILTAFGISPNVAPDIFFTLLASALRPLDTLVVSANLAPLVPGQPDDDAGYLAACERVIGQYDNPETRDWLCGVLLDWGLGSRLGPVAVTIERVSDLYAFVAATHWLQDTTFPWEGSSFSAQENDPLRVFTSIRYTPQRFERWLADAGLEALARSIDPTGQEGIWIVRRPA